MPLHYATDRECLERITPTVGKFDSMEVSFGWIHNTLELSRLALSENLRAETERNPSLTIEDEIKFSFDGGGDLVSPFQPVEEAAGVR
jgi:hypothetical protein